MSEHSGDHGLPPGWVVVEPVQVLPVVAEPPQDAASPALRLFPGCLYPVAPVALISSTASMAAAPVASMT